MNNNTSTTILNHFIFDNKKHTVTILRDNNGEPLFKALDIAKILEIKNIHASLENFDDDEKVLCLISTERGKNNVLMLTDLGVYRLLFNSRKPIAKPFQKWIAKTIRNTPHDIIEKELKVSDDIEQKSVRDATHNALLKAFDKKKVVYFGMIKELNGKVLIKIGSTIDIVGSFTWRHRRDYGEIRVIHVFECKSNVAFETYLLNHVYVTQFMYKDPVKNDGHRSREVVLVNDYELKKIIRIAKRNVKNYQDETPVIDSKISSLDTKMDEIKDLLVKSINNDNVSTNNSIVELSENDNEIEIESESQNNDQQISKLWKHVTDTQTQVNNIQSQISEIKNLLVQSLGGNTTIVKKDDKSEGIEKNMEASEQDEESESVEESDSSEKDDDDKQTTIIVQKKNDKRKRIHNIGTGKCEKCDVAITKWAKRCVECADKHHRFEITKDELEDLVNVQKVSFTSIGKKYGVSDNAIRKRCRNLGVTVPKRPNKKQCVRVRVKGTGKCEECDVKITPLAKKCAKCAGITRRFEVTKEELNDMVCVKKVPFTEIGKKYGVNASSIRKRCVLLGVPVPKRLKKSNA